MTAKSITFCLDGKQDKAILNTVKYLMLNLYDSSQK